MSIILSLRKPLAVKLKQLDRSTARSITDEAERTSAIAQGCAQLLQGKLQSDKPFDEGARDLAVRMTLELYEQAGRLQQQALALSDLFDGYVEN